MAATREESPSIPWYSWLALAAVLAGATLLVLAVNRPVVPATIRWIVTGAWIVVTVVLGIYDFVMGGGSPARARRAAGVDDRPFDRWTISHTGAGLVFGVWFVPLAWVIVLVVVWEAFEIFVPGFGENEIVLNRLVDIGVAVVGWLVVVLLVIAGTGAAFPLI
jgi:hypothetical protein